MGAPASLTPADRARWESKLRDAIARIEALFLHGVKLTIVARMPDDDEAYKVVTNDDLDAVVEVIHRGQIREQEQRS
jgi:hypothetical protein